MKILALETSAKAVSAAVAEDGVLLASGYLNTGLTHSRTLMPIVEAMLKNADLCMDISLSSRRLYISLIALTLVKIP